MTLRIKTIRTLLPLLITTAIMSCQSIPPTQETHASHAVTSTPAVQSVASKPTNAGTFASGYAVYGNWCGPNHPLDDLMNVAPGPLDQLDAACMIHDYCYAEVGYLDCGCDEELTNELKRQLASNDYTTAQALVARGIYNYFAAAPCKQSESNPQAKTAANRGMYRLYNGVKRRVIKVWDWAANDEDAVRTDAEK